MMYTSQYVMLLVSYNLMFHVFLQYLCYYSNGSEIYLKLKLITNLLGVGKVTTTLPPLLHPVRSIFPPKYDIFTHIEKESSSDSAKNQVSGSETVP